MRNAQESESSSHEVQLILFHPANASRYENKATEVRRRENLKLLESAGWRKSGESVCMVEECFVPLEVWQRRRKGKRPEIQHLERNTLMPHEVSAECKHEKRGQR
jgi:hypothetical protein